MTDYNLNFTKGRRIHTSRGWRLLREAQATDDFWSAWRDQKEELKAQGFSVTRKKDVWRVQQWIPLDEEVVPTVPDAEPSGEPMWLNVTPFKHQIEGVAMLVKRPRSILADDMGLGKTLQSLVAARLFNIPVHVICPKSLVENWQREAMRVGVPITIHSWSKLPEEITGDYFLIVDEAHYGQSGRKSKRGEVFMRLAEKAKGCYCLSGTPMKNGRPINLLPLLQACRHPLGDNVRHFHRYFCDAKATRFTKWDVTGAAHLDELHQQTRDVIIRRLKTQCLDLPPKTRVFRQAELSREAEKVYDDTLARLKQSYEQRLREGTINDGADALVLLGQCRLAGSVAKVEMAIEIANEVLEQGQQVVLYTEFLESAKAIHQSLGGELLTGQSENRQAMVDRFQARESRVFIATTKAGGVGITLTAASTVILVDGPWTPGDAVQAEDRLHRIGATSNVTAIWLQYGVDERVDAILNEKEERLTLALEGERKTMSGLKLKSAQLLDIIFGRASAVEFEETI